MKSNLETLQALYDAFAQGNIPFILENIDENFTWQDPSNPSVVPHGGKYSGRDGMGNFFQNLVGGGDTIAWNVDKYVSEGDTVDAFGIHGLQAKNTGKSATTNWVMSWVFKDGKPISGRSYYDTVAFESIYK